MYNFVLFKGASHSHDILTPHLRHIEPLNEEMGVSDCISQTNVDMDKNFTDSRLAEESHGIRVNYEEGNTIERDATTCTSVRETVEDTKISAVVKSDTGKWSNTLHGCRVMDKSYLSRHTRAGNTTRCDYRTASSSTHKCQIHARIGRELYERTQCEYKTNAESDLRLHPQAHSGDKRYKCTQCDYRTASSSEHERHIRIHPGERSYKCTLCDYKSARRSLLTRHMLTHTGVKQHKCTECDYKASQVGSLVYHMRTHTGEKPYKCIQCDYKAVHSGNLRRHMKTHKEVKVTE